MTNMKNINHKNDLITNLIRNITNKMKDTKDKWQFCAKTSSVSENVVPSILLTFCVNVQ